MSSNICGVLLPHKAMEEFREIYKQEFNELLSDEKCTEKAIAVLELFKVLSMHKLDLSGVNKDH